MEKIELKIEGTHCGACAVGIQMMTSQIEGVTSSGVSYEGKQGTFEYDPAKTRLSKQSRSWATRLPKIYLCREGKKAVVNNGRMFFAPKPPAGDGLKTLCLYQAPR